MEAIAKLVAGFDLGSRNNGMRQSLTEKEQMNSAVYKSLEPIKRVSLEPLKPLEKIR
jgi:hypothetical protein